MATIGTKYPTLIDLANQTDYKGSVVSDIIELLSETNPILQDMPFYECNMGAKHLTTVRSGIPEGTWRRLYQGVQPQKGTNTQVEDTTGMLEQWSEVDAKLVQLSADPQQFRLNEAGAFIEGMNQTMAETVFYGNTNTDPERFMGLTARFSDPAAANGAQIINGNGSNDENTSIWMVVWGPRTCHGLYPKGSKAGLAREDKGKTTKELPDGSLYDVYREKFNWDAGMSVRDWRYVVRIANIDVTALNAGSLDVLGLMRKGYWQLKQREMAGGRAAIYCNKDVCEALDAQTTPTASTTASTTAGNIRISRDEATGKELMSYRGMPIRQTDALLNNEPDVAFS